VARREARSYLRRMPEEVREPEDPQAGGRSEVTTPFDKPFFMPVLLFLLALWFGYDGWFNEEIESIMFNRVVFGLLVVLTIWTTYQDVRDTRKPKP
jgi:hypothetical protein